jgi:hypothetical protein
VAGEGEGIAQAPMGDPGAAERTLVGQAGHREAGSHGRRKVGRCGVQKHRPTHACEHGAPPDEAGPEGGNRTRGVGVEASGGLYAGAFQQNLAAAEGGERPVRGRGIDERSWGRRWGVDPDRSRIEDDSQAHDDVGTAEHELQGKGCERIRRQQVAGRENQKGVADLVRDDAEQLRCTLGLRDDGVCEVRIALPIHGRSRGSESVAGSIDQRDHVQVRPVPIRQRRIDQIGTGRSEGPSGDAMRLWTEAVSDSVDRRPRDGFVR